MRFGRWILLLASLLALVVAAQADDQASKTSDKKSGDMTDKLAALERSTWEAVKARDMTAFYAVVDKDGYGADMTGFMSVSQIGEFLKDYELRDYELENLKSIKVSNDVYVLAYTAKQDASYKGQPAPRVVYSSTVFAKRGSKWLAVYHQETPAMAEDANAHEGHQH